MATVFMLWHGSPYHRGMRLPRDSENLRLCVVALLPALVSVGRFWNEFVFDDVFVIQLGTFIHDVRNLPRAFTSHAMVASALESAVGSVPIDTYRPLSIASFFWDAALSGTTPWAYHLTNLVLHSANTLLVLALLRRLAPTASDNLRVTMAIWFGMAPWLSEAHVFINGRSDLFLALFMLGALIVHRAALQTSRIRLALGSGLLTFAALLAKETAVVTLPFVLLVPTALPVGAKRRVLYALPAIALLGAYLVARTLALAGLRVHAGSTQVLRALANLPMLWLDTLIYSWLPTPYTLRNLRDDYAAASMLHQTAAWLVLLATCSVLLISLRKRHYVVAWCAAFALATVSPAIMISTELWPGFGRYIYLAAVGIFCLLTRAVVSVARVAGRMRRAVLLAPLVLGLCSAVLLVDATRGYRDDLTLYGRALAKSPEHAWTHGSVGLTHKRLGQCGRAIPLLIRADTMARAQHEPRYASALAHCLVNVGAFDKAHRVARDGRARFHNQRPEAGFIIAEFLTLPRGHPEARALMQRCLRLWPGRVECIEGLDLVLSDGQRANAFQ